MKFNYVFLLIISVVLMESCKQAPPEIVIVTPAQHDSFTISSTVLGATRHINVWTPTTYNKATDTLPVMYMADGGTQEDFPHIAYTFDSLIKAKQIPPFILVGIENIQRRKDLSGPTSVEKDKEIAPVIGGSEQFRLFIEKELFPEIAQRYTVSSTKGILGESLSGLFVMETFFLQPNMFDYYIAFDPSLWWNDAYLVKNSKELMLKSLNNNKILWFAGSNAIDIHVHTQALEKILLTEKPKEIIWKYEDEPKEEHMTIFKATKTKALIWALNQTLIK